MYKRLTILTFIILSALICLAGLGYYSIDIRQTGMEQKRIAEFASIAEQIRRDVMRKLDDFIKSEQDRPYTDYQYYYVPENIAPQYEQQLAVLTSPLAGKIENHFAYGHFQIDPSGHVTTPQDMLVAEQRQKLYARQYQQTDTQEQFSQNEDMQVNAQSEIQISAPQQVSQQTAFMKQNALGVLNYSNIKNVETNLLPVLNINGSGTSSSESGLADKLISKTTKVSSEIESDQQKKLSEKTSDKPFEPMDHIVSSQDSAKSGFSGLGQQAKDYKQGVLSVREKISPSKKLPAKSKIAESKYQRSRSYPVKSLETQQQAKVYRQRKSVLEENIASNQAFVDQDQQRIYSSRGNVSSSLQTRAAGSENQKLEQPSSPASRISGTQAAQRRTQLLGDEIKESSAKQADKLDVTDIEAESQDRSEPDMSHSQQIRRDNIESPDLSGFVGTFEPRYQSTVSEEQQQDFAYQTPALQQQSSESIAPAVDETVQVRIEPFFPVNVTAENMPGSIFPGQVFLIRHIQIGEKHLLQGFMLNETVLFDEIKESVTRLLPITMKYSIEPNPQIEASYNAILDFGFDQLAVNLFEKSPGWITKDINKLKTWFFAIISTVLLAVTIALVNIWNNARSQLRLARKKDDFISAVSHELRTPLTSIRMYAEMLEKNWVSSEEKLAEYYSSMRQESERLSRLIENVLDFSRIQKGRKKYHFALGSISDCVRNVVDMMIPYAARHGFVIESQYQDINDCAFDSDAVTQIVVNLIDNAVKYARNAADKTITIRTYADRGYIFIEVADKGPGIPRSQVKKVFEQFYRCEAEATRETAGTGLGLALVRKFAQAHNGFVEILNAKPTGAVFKVALETQP